MSSGPPTMCRRGSFPQLQLSSGSGYSVLNLGNSPMILGFTTKMQKSVVQVSVKSCGRHMLALLTKQTPKIRKSYIMQQSCSQQHLSCQANWQEKQTQTEMLHRPAILRWNRIRVCHGSTAALWKNTLRAGKQQQTQQVTSNHTGVSVFWLPHGHLRWGLPVNPSCSAWLMADHRQTGSMSQWVKALPCMRRITRGCSLAPMQPLFNQTPTQMMMAMITRLSIIATSLAANNALHHSGWARRVLQSLWRGFTSLGAYQCSSRPCSISSRIKPSCRSRSSSSNSSHSKRCSSIGQQKLHSSLAPRSCGTCVRTVQMPQALAARFLTTPKPPPL